MKSSKKLLRHGTLLVFAILFPSACQTMHTGGETSSGWECSAFLPISWSADDTHETVEQIIEHNAVWDSMCMMK